MTDVILINTEGLYPTYASRYPYLGIAYLASALENEGLKVGIIDAAALGTEPSDIASIVGSEAPGVVGITTISTSLRQIRSLIEEIRKRHIDTEIVLGGTHVSADPHVVELMGVRYGFAGECERVFPIFCKSILNGRSSEINNLPGLINNNGQLVVNGPELIADLDNLAFPARHLLRNEKYYSIHMNGRATSMLASRGCPYNCIFCSRVSKTKVRCRSPENIIGEMHEIRDNYGCKYIHLADEVFTVNREWVLSVCELMQRERTKITWGCKTRADLIDAELITEMKAAGCKEICFGVETGSERTRKLLNKNIGDQLYLSAFNMCKEAGISPRAAFMLGHPGETREDIECSIRFAKQLNAGITTFQITMILPASQLFDMSIEEGGIQADRWNQFALGLADVPFYIPPSCSQDEMLELYQEALRRINYRPKYIVGRLAALRSADDVKQLWRAFLASRSFRKRYQQHNKTLLT